MLAALITVTVLLALAVFTIVLLGLYIKQLRKEAARDQASVDAAWKHVAHQRGVLEGIRDSGPTGPDPLPPCQWCGQGSGHWGMVKNARGHWVDQPQNNPKCPSVVAWKELRGGVDE